MLLYTAHGDMPADMVNSTARNTGLERYLGYRPCFCSLINPDSLSDTWFRLFSASPRYVEHIDVYEVDAAQAVPMDVVTWCQTCFGAGDTPAPDDDELFRAALNADNPDSTDYILRADVSPARSWRFDVHAMLNGCFDSLDLEPDEQRALEYSMARVRALPREQNGRLYTSFNLRVDQMSLEMWYRIMVASGMTAFVWSHVLGKRIAPELLAIDPMDLMSTVGYQRAQQAIVAWDNSLGAPGVFGHAEFASMRRAFLTGCDQLARRLVEQKAAATSTARNGTCFCGSERKYKQCCMRKGMDALANEW